MKVEKSNQKINPYGGINFTIDSIKQSGVLQLIDKQLGIRPSQAKYSYSDLLLNLWSVFYCGGDCAEDLGDHLSEFLCQVPGLKVASPDTVLRALKSLATEKETVKSSKGNTYEINKHEELNQLNISILKHFGILQSGKFYDLDYDNEVLKTEKKDTKKTYKKVKGYFPGMATISGNPVYFENRDGNMNVKTNQAEVLKRCFKMLSDNEIYIDRVRVDAGSYAKDVIMVFEENSNYFFVRANRCDFLTDLLLQPRNWKKETINEIEYEVCSIDYQPFSYEKGEKPKVYRLVIMRRKKQNSSELDLFTKDNMEYRSILTNDFVPSEKEVIEFYNGRGGEERAIDVMNNDFGWHRMPFSFMEENTVFLLVMMICKNIYTWLITKFSQVFPGLKKNYRIKKFIFRFITVPVKWIKRSKQMVLKVFSNKPYEVLQC